MHVGEHVEVGDFEFDDGAAYGIAGGAGSSEAVCAAVEGFVGHVGSVFVSQEVRNGVV